MASQMSPPKGTQPQNYVVAMEHPPAKHTGNGNIKGKIHSPLIEEGLVRWTDKWSLPPINLYSSPETKARNALCACGFWE